MVYFIQQGDDGPIKIGYTSKDDVKDRLSSLQTGNPYPLRVFAALEHGGRAMEKRLHSLFKSARMQGEWFEFTDELKSHILCSINPFDYEVYRNRPVLVKWTDDYDSPLDPCYSADLCFFCGYACSGSPGYNFDDPTCLAKFTEIGHIDGTVIYKHDGFIVRNRGKYFETEQEIEEHRLLSVRRKDWMTFWAQKYGKKFKDYYYAFYSKADDRFLIPGPGEDDKNLVRAGFSESIGANSLAEAREKLDTKIRSAWSQEAEEIRQRVLTYGW